MSKWIERLCIAVLIVIMIVTLIGLYSTKRECMEIGGTTARGLFWLECIK